MQECISGPLMPLFVHALPPRAGEASWREWAISSINNVADGCILGECGVGAIHVSEDVTRLRTIIPFERETAGVDPGLQKSPAR